jgi:AraC-like DNA-binding protein
VAASFQTPTLFTIAEDLSRMQIDTNVDESDIARIKPGDAASFTVDAYPDRKFAGKVVQVRNAPMVTQNVVTYNAVIGVDNDEILCELCDPPLSSIIPNPQRIGYEAASMLDTLMAGKEVAKREILIEPVGVKTRQSTDVLAVDDPDVAAAMTYIRDHALDGCTVQDLLAHVPLARSCLERRFRKYLGRSPQAEIHSIRIKRINYVDSVQQKVFDRMISERKRIAAQYRSEGEGERAAILGQMERETARITLEAFRKSQEIRGKADAEATRIYAEAFGKNPEFYTFYRTLDLYRNFENRKSAFVLTTEADIFKYLKNTTGKPEK